MPFITVKMIWKNKIIDSKINLVVFLCIVQVKCENILTTWYDYESFNSAGWNGKYQAASTVADLPPDFGNLTDFLNGEGLWYFYGNGSTSQEEILWTIPEHVSESEYLNIRFVYYTNATVTIFPVLNDWFKIIPTTEGRGWGVELYELYPNANNEISIAIMGGGDGYLIFDLIEIQFDGEKLSTTECDILSTTHLSTIETSASTEDPVSEPLTSTSTSTEITSAYTTEILTTLVYTDQTETTYHSTSTLQTDVTTDAPPIFSSAVTEYITQPETTPLTSSTTAKPTVHPTTTELPDFPSKPGDICHLLNKPCTFIPNTECVFEPLDHTYRCICVPGSDLSADGNKCLLKAEYLYSECETDDQCVNISHSSCKNNSNVKECCCKSHFVPSITLKYCLNIVTTIGESCTESIQCKSVLGDTTVCRNGYCNCAIDYIYSENWRQCFEIQQVGNPCFVHEQCIAGSGIGTICDEQLKTCECTNGFYEVEGKCYKPSKLHDPCMSGAECLAGSSTEHVKCSEEDHTCTCIDRAFEWSDNCYMRLYIGDVCTGDEECEASILGPVCCNETVKKCLCSKGHIANNQLMQCEGFATSIIPSSFSLASAFLCVNISYFFVQIS